MDEKGWSGLRILDHIESPQDIKLLNEREKYQLCDELREQVIQTVLQNGGHLASNLGVVELTVALHTVFNCPQDKIIWDVGHQSYVHKLLTGRKARFASLRQQDGISGFPKFEESDCDCFNTGHSSTAISAALGLVHARDLQKQNHHVIAVLGDGALTGGMSYEALSDAGFHQSRLIVILNDNAMSISENVGGMNMYLGRLRTNPKYMRFKRHVKRTLEHVPFIGRTLAHGTEKLKNRIKFFVLPRVFFEELGFTYIGPLDGHDLVSMTEMLLHASKMDHPVFLHVLTQKGRGYRPAETNPEKYHGVAPHVIEQQKTDCAPAQPNNSALTGQVLMEMAQQDARVVAITAAMCAGTGLDAYAKTFPDRFFDVGIAEQHAVTMAAGMARGGLRPYFAVYSTFLQRAYDQLLHDVCLQNLPVTLCIDRAGLTGEDGDTHQGLFDLSMLLSMPRMHVFAPTTQQQMRQAFDASLQMEGPCAIRYPKGCLPACAEADACSIFQWPLPQLLPSYAILATGKTVSIAQPAAAQLNQKGVPTVCIPVACVKPMDVDALQRLAQSCSCILTVEEGMYNGGFGSSVAQWMQQHFPNCRVLNMAIADQFVEQGTIAQQWERVGLTVDVIVQQLMRAKEEKSGE